MKRKQLAGLLVLAMAVAAALGLSRVGSAADEAGEPALSAPIIDPDADEIMRDVSEYLKTAKEFTFHAEITFDDLTEWGQKLEYGASLDVDARRKYQSHNIQIGLDQFDEEDRQIHEVIEDDSWRPADDAVHPGKGSEGQRNNSRDHGAGDDRVRCQCAIGNQPDEHQRQPEVEELKGYVGRVWHRVGSVL